MTDRLEILRRHKDVVAGLERILAELQEILRTCHAVRGGYLEGIDESTADLVRWFFQTVIHAASLFGGLFVSGIYGSSEALEGEFAETGKFLDELRGDVGVHMRKELEADSDSQRDKATLN